MDINPQQSAKPISDDQELAKVLAGVNSETNLGYEESPIVNPVVMPAPSAVNIPVSNNTSAVSSDNLMSIKKDALTDLRPLVDKLSLEPEEKFDTYLLLLRSSDDKALIAPAYAAAKLIADESRRAQALLDVIKEIDYLSSSHQ